MRNLNKLAAVLGMASLGVMVLTSCEGGDLFNVGAPDWISERVDSIANNKPAPTNNEIEGIMEDVYTIGKTDYTSGWWAEFSKYYVVPDGEKWQAQYILNINPNDNTYYKNYALIVANKERGAEGYSEYGAIRYDLTGDANAFNSGWGTVFGIIEGNDFKYTDSNLKLSPVDNNDANVQKLGGKVTLTVDRTDANRFYIEMNNGEVIKTFDMPSNIAAGEDIYCFIVPEGSYLSFQGTTIEPIGGCTSKEDKQPISMTLKGVPGKVLAGTSFDDAFAGVTAVIQFEQEVSKTVTFADLTLSVIPDMNELGTKTLVAAYNKTYKGEAADKAVIGAASFQLVDKLYTTVGDMGCTTPFWGAHTANIQVKPGETQISTFTNYTCGASNWNNFVVILNAEDVATEYAVVRADNYGWGDGYAAATNTGGQADWGQWLAAMNGAVVTVYVTNNGDGTADVKTVMNGIDGETYYQDYYGLQVNSDDLWYRLTVDGSCMVFDQLVGAEDNSTGFWGAHSPNIQIPSGQTITQTFINHTPGGANWNNFVVILNAEDVATEYAVVRADNYGWGDGYAAATNSGGQADWGQWLAAMDGARTTVSITNNGDGTADIYCVMEGTDGETYIQDYYGLQVNSDDLWFRFTIDGSHLVMDNN